MFCYCYVVERRVYELMSVRGFKILKYNENRFFLEFLMEKEFRLIRIIR